MFSDLTTSQFFCVHCATGQTFDMTLTVDQMLEHVGSMGCFQWTVVVVCGTILIPVTFQTLIMTFMALEPPWKCVNGSELCNFTRKFIYFCLFNPILTGLFRGSSDWGGEETTRGCNSGTVKDIAVIFWQHTHDRKLVYLSSQNNGFGVA